MIKSMTGFGKSRLLSETKDINVEIKSVNNRYLDLNYKMPRFLSFAEERIKNLISSYVQRGKIDIFVSIGSNAQSGKQVVLDKELAMSYITAFKDLCSQTELEFDLSASRFLNSDIVKIQQQEQDDEQVWADLEPVIKDCLENYNVMREREGQRLKNDILNKGKIIGGFVDEIEKIIPKNIEAYRQKLLDKVHEVLENYEIDENRILAEIAIYSDKVCVDEEIVRLRSHLTELSNMLNSDGPTGKKLDFLVQEMNRETNTIGSKSNDLGITSIVIDMKNEIEKIREQIQNIE